MKQSIVLIASATLFPFVVEAKQPNVLFICIDDLRNELGCYGSMVKSPNLDLLASEGSLFTNHYVSVPTSGASRASLLSGLYPRDTEDTKNGACDFRFAGKPEGENPETMFHALKRNGYYTVGIGKISHSKGGYAYEDTSDELQLPHSWNEMIIDVGKWENAYNASVGYSDGSSQITLESQGKPYECADVEDREFVDGLTAELALQKLDELANREEPFCLAVGFMRPHLPFVSPKKYWDLYDVNQIELSEYGIPKNTNNIGLGNSSEFNNQYQGGEESVSLKDKASDDYARKLRHAYYASVSYVDAQVGKIIKKLEDLGLDEDTIIIVWGDHGWNLGDMNIWGKHTNYEPSLKSTLIINTPDKKEAIVNDRIVGSVDIYPTLMELCGIKTDYQLDGHSLVRLLSNPDDKKWNDVAYSYFGQSISLRVPEYRITKFCNGTAPLLLFKLGKSEFETENIADQNPELIEKLLPILKMGNTNSLNF